MDNDKIKHLEFIQSNITRMNNCSFQIKSWSITVLSALLAIYVSSIGEGTKGNIYFVYLPILPTFLFWLLDSYYLLQERKFRGLYNDLIVEKKQDEIKAKDLRPFNMPLDKYKGDKYNMFSVAFSKTEATLYLTIIIMLLLAGWALGGVDISAIIKY